MRNLRLSFRIKVIRCWSKGAISPLRPSSSLQGISLPSTCKGRIEKDMLNLRYLALPLIRATYKPLLVFSFFSALSLSLCQISYCAPPQGDIEHYKGLRYRMVDKQIAGRGIDDENVLHAMRDVPRHMFVPKRKKSSAYDRNQSNSIQYVLQTPYSSIIPCALFKN